MNTDVFAAHESNVRRYGRSFPAVFTRALGATIWDEAGNSYIDFLVGSGALNYGHNNQNIIAPAIEYLVCENILLSLDMYTVAKREFLETFVDSILKPRGFLTRYNFLGRPAQMLTKQRWRWRENIPAARAGFVANVEMG